MSCNVYIGLCVRTFFVKVDLCVEGMNTLVRAELKDDIRRMT